MPASRTHIVAGILCVLGSLALAPQRAAADDDKTKAAEVKTPPIPQPVETPAPDPDRDDPDRIVTLAEAARLSSLSIDTLRRNHRDKFIRLSERRYGMRRRDVLLL